MADSPEARRARNEETVRRLMGKISRFENAIDEVSEDLQFELPYGPPQFQMTGAKTWAQATQSMYDAFKSFVLEPVEFHLTLDPDEVITLYRSKGEVLPTGKAYENSYIGVFRFTEDGRVKFWREYHNPNKVKEAFPPEWWSTPS